MAASAIPGRVVQPKQVRQTWPSVLSIGRPGSAAGRPSIEVGPDSPMSGPTTARVRPQSAMPTAARPARPASRAGQGVERSARVRPISADLGCRTKQETHQRALELARRNRTEWARFGCGMGAGGDGAELVCDR